MVTLSKEMDDLNQQSKVLDQQKEDAVRAGGDKPDSSAQADIGKADDAQAENARQFSIKQSEFQAASQMFSILNNSFSTAIKSIGEGLSSMARKQ